MKYHYAQGGITKATLKFDERGSSFYSKQCGKEDLISIGLETLMIGVSKNDYRLTDVSGFYNFPGPVKIMSLQVPEYKKGKVIAEVDKKTKKRKKRGTLFVEFNGKLEKFKNITIPHYEPEYYKHGDAWPNYIDLESGWICIGDPIIKKQYESVMFATNSIVVLNNKELIALWIKPKKLPKFLKKKYSKKKPQKTKKG